MVSSLSQSFDLCVQTIHIYEIISEGEFRCRFEIFITHLRMTGIGRLLRMTGFGRLVVTIACLPKRDGSAVSGRTPCSFISSRCA